MKADITETQTASLMSSSSIIIILVNSTHMKNYTEFKYSYCMYFHTVMFKSSTLHCADIVSKGREVTIT